MFIADGALLRGGPADGAVVLGAGACVDYPRGCYLRTGDRTLLGLVIYLWHGTER